MESAPVAQFPTGLRPVAAHLADAGACAGDPADPPRRQEQGTCPAGVVVTADGFARNLHPAGVLSLHPGGASGLCTCRLVSSSPALWMARFAGVGLSGYRLPGPHA